VGLLECDVWVHTNKLIEPPSAHAFQKKAQRTAPADIEIAAVMGLRVELRTVRAAA
jgi:hypothetical protein